MTDEPIRVGDVCLDLTQGRPVHVLEDCHQTAAEWSDANNYELCENYGNDRLGASDDDAVYEVVYCSNAKSEPSKTYAMPESRLLRIETEAADADSDGRPVAKRAQRATLAALYGAAMDTDVDYDDPVEFVDFLTQAMDDDLVLEARELAEADRLGGDD
jgi:hypothetical protein